MRTPLRTGRDHAALAFVLSTLGHPTRLEVVQWLLLRGPLSVRGLREFMTGDITGAPA
ncbi:hypothetical protein [Calidifontibacter indicus]|uniref:ArsR family transcriptional regulator n=1 Tax=Calidifontibacter indicus TaxID=419650 RepID=A0A3D9U602_9MICO|nr:hypothetical protein [Calidifontibacter indicus]REF24626.1 hypothetical protein DFJ65_3412 [Calidifontibacter indicus]